MPEAVFIVGAVVGALLIALLIATRIVPPLRLWPTPGPMSWQSYVFWPLFRGLNVLCFVMASLDRGPWLGTPAAVRVVASVALVASVAAFVAAFRLLGRDNSYGASDGLVTAGIYQWTRNPQNAMLIVVYACLAVAADSLRVTVLCAAMIAVYALMVFCEEPWLEKTYGEAYRRYMAQVPRFFPLRRAVSAVMGRGR